MDKYYISNLGTELAQNGHSRLVSVQFSRRPPTFGLLHLFERDGDGQIVGDIQTMSSATSSKATNSQALCLSCLNLTENKVKFETMREFELKSSAHFICFDLLSLDQVLIEGSTNLSIEERLQAKCFMLTRDGDLYACSMVDGQLERVLSLGGSFASRGEKCVHFVLQSGPEIDESLPRAGGSGSKHRSRSPATANAELPGYNHLFYVHLLTERTYALHRVQVRENSEKSLEFQTELMWTFGGNLSKEPEQGGIELSIKSRAKFARLYAPLVARPDVVLIELLDRSLLILNNNKCVHSELASGRLASSDLGSMFACALDHRSCLLVSFDSSKRQLLAHSLLIDEEDEREHEQEDNRDEHYKDKKNQSVISEHLNDQETNDSNENDNDPDKLLPKSPSFELELCWSIDLTSEVDGLKTLDDYEEVDEEPWTGGSAHKQQAGQGDDKARDKHEQCAGSLCAYWSQEQLQRSHQQTRSRDSIGGAPGRVWPKFIILAYKCHLVIFSFEQQAELPFSLVYDRAFLGQLGGTLGDEEPSASGGKQTRSGGGGGGLYDPLVQIDPKQKPRVVHNFKLIGAQLGDAFYNFVFLKERIFFKLLRQFDQLGLVVAISSLGHIFAFKMNSSALGKLKNNLYQQQVIDSLRASSLLHDELAKLERINSTLRDDIVRLEKQSATFAKNAAAASAQSSSVSMMLLNGEQTHRTPMSELGDKAAAEQHKQQHEQQQQKLLDNLEQLLCVQLEPCNDFLAVVECQYELAISWPNLIQISRILIFCDAGANCALIPWLKYNQANSKAIRSIHFGQSATAGRAPLSKLNFGACWALIELVENRPEHMNLRQPVLLIDGAELAGGQIHVYFTLSDRAQQNQNHPERRISRAPVLNKSRNWRILAAASELAIGSYHRNSRASNSMIALPCTSRLLKKSLRTRPLQSYRYITTNLRGNTQSARGSLLELKITSDSGEAQQKTSNTNKSELTHDEILDWQTLASWLAECLDHRQWSQLLANEFGTSDNQREQQIKRHHRLGLRFESPFTHCFIEVELSRANENKELSLTLISDDFIAMELIKRHLLKKATDRSIKLNIQRNSVVEANHLRHMLGLQLNNIEALHRARTFVRASSPKSGGKDQDNNGRQRATELMFESLMNEARRQLSGQESTKWSQTLLMGSQSELTTSWLEKSFRKDIEDVLAAERRQQGISLTTKSHSTGILEANGARQMSGDELISLMLARFILQSLLVYDNSNAIRQTSEAARQLMLTKLLEFIDKTETERQGISNDVRSIFDIILSDWNASKDT